MHVWFETLTHNLQLRSKLGTLFVCCQVCQLINQSLLILNIVFSDKLLYIDPLIRAALLFVKAWLVQTGIDFVISIIDVSCSHLLHMTVTGNMLAVTTK